jgi:AcrR family transcriptional regulator
MQQIADAAGINKATLYHHFRDKEELFLDVVREEIARATATMMLAIEAGGDFRAKLYRMVAAFFATTELDYFRLIADLHEYVSEARRVRLLEETPPPWKAIRPVIEDAIAAGEIKPIPVDLAVSMLFHATFGQIKLEKMGTLAYPADDALATLLVDLLMDGLAAPH